MAGQSNRNAALKPPMKAKPAEVRESIPMLDLRAQYAVIGEEIRAALDEVLAEQQFILGPQLAALEEEVARYCGRRFGIGVGSGTDALVLSLRACGVGPSDEVIRSEEHTSELQSRLHLVCRLLLEKKKSGIKARCDTRRRSGSSHRRLASAT